MDREHRVAAEPGKLDSTAPAADDLAAALNAVLGEMRAGKYLDAKILCRQLLETNPENPEILHLMALVCFNAQQFDHAVEWASRALRNDAKPAYLTTLGIALLNLERREDAVRVFDKAVQLKPDDAGLWSNLAHALIEAGHVSDALLCLARAHQLDPQNPKIRNDLGHGFMLLGRHEEALTWFDRALESRPDSVETLNNKAFSLTRLHRFDEAFAVYAHSKAVAPGNAATDFNVALLQMLTGSFAAGWLGREARLRLPSAAPYPDLQQPRWFGDQDIAGKTILLYADEGIGDSIQFIRYVPMVAARGARVVLAVEEALRALLASLPGVAECVAKEATLPAFDLQCPISSLPLVFNATLETIPVASSYLPRPPQDRVRAWEARLGPHARLRVGLVWSGNPRHVNDRDRSVSLRSILPFLDADASFFSLQKDLRPDDKATLAESRIIDWTPQLADFAETAALVSCLDLVISVDTSVAHLAAALGRPTWILLPYTPDYRWLLGRDDSPWYPTARLFRQSESCDYGSVVERVCAELQATAGKWCIKALDQPADAMLWWQKGNALVEAGRNADALVCFEQAIRLDPCHGDAHYKAGHLLHSAGRLDEALVLLTRSAELQSDHVPTWQLRAVVFNALNRFEEAIADDERAIRLDPANADVYCNMGNALKSLGRLDTALSCYDRSLRIRSTIAGAANRANCLTELGRFEDAIAASRAALTIDPNHPALVWNLSLLQMLVGDFDAGWRGREARWKIPEIAAGYPRLATPMWVGQELIAGKTIAVCQGEGLGDAIQFARYIPLLAKRGARVILVVDQPLVPLLSVLPGVSLCLAKKHGLVVPPFDFHIAIDSLPLAFGTRLDNIPAKPYLPPADAARVKAWEARLGPHERLRVGLVWSGNPNLKNDRNRSMSFRMLSRILDVDATFVSVQKNPRAADAEALRERSDVIDLTAHLADFAETAALVSCLDLVIAVDTSVAHLAAALGRPTWILLPYVGEWRWLLGRDDSPWYPSVHLFRQDESRDYASVVERVRAALAELAAACSTAREDHPKD